MDPRPVVTWNDREITNPFLRGCAILFGITVAVGAMLVVVLMLMLLVLLSPILVPLHFILRATDRPGFVTEENSSYGLVIDGNSFRKRPNGPAS